MEIFQLISSSLLWLIVLVDTILILGIVRRLGVISANQEFNSEPQMLRSGEQLPYFEIDPIQGEKASLRDFSSKNTVFLFLSPDCRPCREETPRLDLLSHSAKRAGVDFVFIILADFSSTQAFAEELHIQSPIFSAPRGTNDMARLFRVTATPSFCYFNSKGVVISSGILGPEWESLISEWQEYSAIPED